MINNIGVKILNKLIDKYERSKSFTGGNKVNQNFRTKVASLFPAYSDHSNYDSFQKINEEIAFLKSKGYIIASPNKARVYDELTLNVDKLAETYIYLGRTPKNDKNSKLKDILYKYIDENEILGRYCMDQLKRIEQNLLVKYFNEDYDEFANILKAVKHLTKVESEQYIREFSIQLYKDSKTFLNIQGRVENLLFEYGDYPEKDQILGSFNLVRNPTYVNFKGAGRIRISGQMININKLSGDIAISSKMLDEIDVIDVTGKNVITIENLTSFHRFNEKDFFIIYLGGYHNTIRKDFIKRLNKQNPNVSYYHFGDIDAGGFYILEHLKKNTDVLFKPYKMDVDTLKDYVNYSKPLTDNDKQRLQRLLCTEHYEVIKYMLDNDCKLEQEAVNQ